MEILGHQTSPVCCIFLLSRSRYLACWTGLLLLQQSLSFKSLLQLDKCVSSQFQTLPSQFLFTVVYLSKSGYVSFISTLLIFPIPLNKICRFYCIILSCLLVLKQTSLTPSLVTLNSILSFKHPVSSENFTFTFVIKLITLYCKWFAPAYFSFFFQLSGGSASTEQCHFSYRYSTQSVVGSKLLKIRSLLSMKSSLDFLSVQFSNGSLRCIQSPVTNRYLQFKSQDLVHAGGSHVTLAALCTKDLCPLTSSWPLTMVGNPLSLTCSRIVTNFSEIFFSFALYSFLRASKSV